MGSLGVLAKSTVICAPLLSQSVEQMVNDMHVAKKEGADVVEIRLDCIKDFRPSQDLQILLRKKPLPVLVVYRYKSNSNITTSTIFREFCFIARFDSIYVIHTSISCFRLGFIWKLEAYFLSS